jgi:hypothetical protein
MAPRFAPHIATVLPTIVLSAALGAAGAQTSTQPATGTIELAAMALDAPPAGFAFARTGKGGVGQWKVVTDASAAGGRALAQLDTDRTDYRFPLAIYEPFSAANVEVTVRFKPVAGRVDEAGGIAVRLAGPNDYYVVRANALEDNVRFYRVVKGNRQELKSADVKVAPNVWHTLSLTAEGERFSVTFDGTPLYSVTDKTFGQAGQIALWTKADSVTHFDTIRYRQLP